MLIASDDAIVRGGLRAAASLAGLADVGCISLGDCADPSTHVGPWDYVVVFLARSSAGLDRLPAVKAITDVAPTVPTTTKIALLAFDPSPLVTLRLAEAGCAFAIPYLEVSDNPVDLFGALRRGDAPAAYAIPSQWSLRQELGLRWNGAVGPFLETAMTMPPEVWTTHRPQHLFGVGRGPFRTVQRAAKDVAGLPEPDFSRYASSTRRPPELPEWPPSLPQNQRIRYGMGMFAGNSNQSLGNS